MAIDSKYGEIEITGIPADEPVFILRAQDILTPDMVLRYGEGCRAAGSPDTHVDAVLNARQALMQWQEDNPDAVKVAD